MDILEGETSALPCIALIALHLLLARLITSTLLVAFDLPMYYDTKSVYYISPWFLDSGGFSQTCQLLRLFCWLGNTWGERNNLRL